MYVLKLAEDGRILGILDSQYQTAQTPLIEDYPQEVKDGNACDYRYVDGQWIYDPLPRPNGEGTQFVTWAELETALKEGVNGV